MFGKPIVSFFTRKSKANHLNTINQILRYLASSQNKSIILMAKPEPCSVQYLNFY